MLLLTRWLEATASALVIATASLPTTMIMEHQPLSFMTTVQVQLPAVNRIMQKAIPSLALQTSHRHDGILETANRHQVSLVQLMLMTDNVKTTAAAAAEPILQGQCV